MFEIEHLYYLSYKFDITNGNGCLKIKMAKYMDYLEYKSPVVINWRDRGPATFMCDYLTSLPLSWKLKQHILSNLNDELTGTELNKLAYDRVEELLSMFENGTYGILYCPELEDAQLIFPPEINDVNNKEIFLRNWEHVESDHPDFEDDTLLLEPYTDCFPLIATQKEVDENRVEFYTAQIRQGKRPHAVIFCSCIEREIVNKDGSRTSDSLYSNLYVIDGHHKLMAYQQAGIPPAIIFIAHLPESEESVLPDCAQLFEKVQPYHFAAMMGKVKPTDFIARKIMAGNDPLIKNYLQKYSYYFRVDTNTGLNTNPGSFLKPFKNVLPIQFPAIGFRRMISFVRRKK